MKLKEPLLLLLLLAAAAAAAELKAQNALGTGAQELRGSQPKGAYGMKLCGREFIRAVIFICGGSRWKRLSEDREAEEKPLLGGGGSVEVLQSNSDKGMEDIKLQSVLDPELEQLQHIGQLTGQQPLKLPFNFYGNYNAHVPTSDNLSEYFRQIENAVQQSRGGPGRAELMKSNNFPWVNSPRRKQLVQTANNKVLKPVKLESAKDPEQKHPQSPTGSDFPHVKYARRKHTRPSQWPDADPSWTDFFDIYKTVSQDDSDQLGKDQTKVAVLWDYIFHMSNILKENVKLQWTLGKLKKSVAEKDVTMKTSLLSMCSKVKV